MRCLIFGTVYADTSEKQELAHLWTELNNRINPGMDFMLVDSSSPLQVHVPGRNHVMCLDGNVGHLSRGGQDGWGRAFCAGLQWAIDDEYDFVAHVEGDSLFRLPWQPIFDKMNHDGIRVATVPVRGTRVQERNWVETGLMAFDVQWIRQFDLVRKYDWQNGHAKAYPRTPEWHLYQFCLPWLHYMTWRAERGDRGQISASSSLSSYDWITHASIEVMRAFALNATERVVA